MARQKKKANLKNMLPMIFGLLLFIFALWLSIAIFTVGVSGLSAENWLGPYLGKSWIFAMLQFFGYFSILFFNLSVYCFSFFCFSKFSKKKILFAGLCALALTLSVSYFVSLSGYNTFIPEKDWPYYGGILGITLSKHLAVFLGTKLVLPYLVSTLCIFISLFATLHLCGIKPIHFRFLLTPFIAFCNYRKNKKALTPELALEKLPKETKKQKGTSDIFDETRLDLLPNKAKPFQASGAFATALGKGNTLNEPFSEETSIDLSEKGKEDRLSYLMRYIEENKNQLDDLEIRKLRDEIVELKRVRQINEWEDENCGLPAVQGIVRKEELPVSEKEEVKEKTILEEKVPQKTLIQEPKEKIVSDISAIQEKPIEYDEYKIPNPFDILKESSVQTPDYTEEELQEIARELELHLDSYKVKGKVTNIITGPVITRFEVEPGPGIKVSKFLSLQDDLALALSAISIRILAPIPGKSVVGIEIPNRKAHIIFCRDLFKSEVFSPAEDKLHIILGKDITGVPFSMDLAKAPHLLIAGQTGSGKSVCINVLMASLLLSKTPDDLRLLLVDPKVVELKMYENIPHLLSPVITQPDVAIQALKWMCNEMDRRYEVLAKAKVRNIAGFNAKITSGELPEELPEEERKKMFFIVLIIDELADLMMVAGKEVETYIARIAQKARAVGIHLVLATQRPSANVITGLIKANLPTRIAFKVGSALDSRIILDTQGAERLLGKGDMLYRPGDKPNAYRVHGAFLSDSEAEALAFACSDQNVFYPQIETFEEESFDAESESEECSQQLDKKIWEVALWAANVRGISTSGVQRTFNVGFSRAGRIVDQLERLGICGKSKGNSKPRDILLSEEEIYSLKERYK